MLCRQEIVLEHTIELLVGWLDDAGLLRHINIRGNWRQIKKLKAQFHYLLNSPRIICNCALYTINVLH